MEHVHFSETKGMPFHYFVNKGYFDLFGCIILRTSEHSNVKHIGNYWTMISTSTKLAFYVKQIATNGLVYCVLMILKERSNYYHHEQREVLCIWASYVKINNQTTTSVCFTKKKAVEVPLLEISDPNSVFCHTVVQNVILNADLLSMGLWFTYYTCYK